MPCVSTISMDEMSSTSASADTKFYPITVQATQPGEAGDENMTDLSGTVNKQLMEFVCNFMGAFMQETSQVGDTGNHQDECLDKFHGGEVDGELKMMAVAKISDTWTGTLNMLPNAVAVELTLESKTRETVVREIGLGFEGSLFNKEVFGGMFPVVKLHHESHADETGVNAKEFSASTNIDSGLDMFASVYPFLEELRLKRMIVSAENLEYLVRSISGFKALSLVSCYGFNTNGLASIISYCRNLVELVEEEVLVDACRAMPYLFEGTKDKIQTVIEVVVCLRLMELLLLPSHIVLIPALRTVRNIVTGDVYFSSTYVSASFHVWIWDPGSAIHRRGCNCNMDSGEELRMVWDPGIYIIKLGNIPHITLCDTGSPRKNVDMGIPANNKGERNIVCLLWLSTSISPIASFHIFGVESRDQIP